jgi:hypothetical protein
MSAMSFAWSDGCPLFETATMSSSLSPLKSPTAVCVGLDMSWVNLACGAPKAAG